MEKKTFKFYQLRVMELMERVKELVYKIQSAPDPLTMVTAKRKLDRERNQAKIWKEKMDAYGGGTIVEVTGTYFKSLGTEDNPAFARTKFVMYIDCQTIEDAQNLFEAQVSEKYKFETETIKFNTIELKSLYTIT